MLAPRHDRPKVAAVVWLLWGKYVVRRSGNGLYPRTLNMGDAADRVRGDWVCDVSQEAIACKSRSVLIMARTLFLLV